MNRLRRRLFAPVLVLVAALAGVVAYGAHEAIDGVAALRRHVAEVRRANELVVRLNALRGDRNAAALRSLASPDPRLGAELDRLDLEADAATRELAALQTTPAARRLFDQFVAARAVDAAARARFLDAARAEDRRLVDLAHGRWELARRRADALLADVSGYQLNQLQRTLAELDARRARSLWLFALALVISAGVVVVFALVVARTVVRPITRLTAAAGELPSSRFEPPPEVLHRSDELGALARTLLRVTEEMRLATERLRDADRRKDEFLGVLSHELRNPLAPIRNAIHVLGRADAPAPAVRRAREVLHRQTEHLTRIVDDLLDVTRIARGKVELRRERVDLVELTHKATEDQRVLLDAAGLALALDLPDAPVWLDADPVRVAQIVGNLLHNASKFTPRGGSVRVTVAVTGGEAQLRVRDDGAGIDAALLPRVFDPFVQAERSLARTQGGLGLGLALVKGLAELHGGGARAASAGPGAGAEVTVTFPLAPDAPAAVGAGPAPAAARPLRVLVVDDNRDAAETLAELVRLLGHAADVAFDGPEALARVEASRPDVVICDIGLPGLSGYDVARRIRARPGPAPRLVALSGYARAEDVERARESGFDAHVAKPADLRVVERLLTLHADAGGAVSTG